MFLLVLGSQGPIVPKRFVALVQNRSLQALVAAQHCQSHLGRREVWTQGWWALCSTSPPVDSPAPQRTYLCSSSPRIWVGGRRACPNFIGRNLSKMENALKVRRGAGGAFKTILMGEAEVRVPLRTVASVPLFSSACILDRPSCGVTCVWGSLSCGAGDQI